MKTGVQKLCNQLKKLDSGFRRNDKKWCFSTFYETINTDKAAKRRLSTIFRSYGQAKYTKNLNLHIVISISYVLQRHISGLFAVLAILMKTILLLRQYWPDFK